MIGVLDVVVRGSTVPTVLDCVAAVSDEDETLGV